MGDKEKKIRVENLEASVRRQWAIVFDLLWVSDISMLQIRFGAKSSQSVPYMTVVAMGRPPFYLHVLLWYASIMREKVKIQNHIVWRDEWSTTPFNFLLLLGTRAFTWISDIMLNLKTQILCYIEIVAHLSHRNIHESWSKKVCSEKMMHKLHFL